MADLFDHASVARDASCGRKFGSLPPASQETRLVLVCFQISVWSGMQTEQTSIEEGAEYMKRRRIIPAVMLKPFLDFRARARALCQEMGEPYLNGYVMREHDARIAERALSVWREEFCRKRDQIFAPKYQEILSERLKGITPPGCSPEAVFPQTDFVLRRITFEFDTFALADSGKGARSSKEAFIKGLALRFIDELDFIEESVDASCIRDATLSRLCALKERVELWLEAQPLFLEADSAMEESLRLARRAEVWARDQSAFKEGIRRARKALSIVLEEPETLADAAAKPAASEESRQSVSFGFKAGAAGMIARGRSLFSF